MSVYGDMLAFFPEQVRRFSYFSMIPNTVSGYQERTEIAEVKGVLQHLRKSQLGEDVSTLTEHIVPTFWTKQKLDVGKFWRAVGDNQQVLLALRLELNKIGVDETVITRANVDKLIAEDITGVKLSDVTKVIEFVNKSFTKVLKGVTTVAPPTLKR